MSTLTGTRPAPKAGTMASPVGRFWRKRVIDRLRRTTTGRIVLVEGDERIALGTPDLEDLQCTLRVLNPRFYRRLALGGSIGASESYMDGDWTADDLTMLMRIFARDLRTADRLERGWAKLRVFVDRARYRIRANTLSGSRRNIADHYDLGNEFFALFLDPTMTYSCGVFEGPEAPLEEASTLKYDLICRKLGLGSSDEVLEIGTGWGGFALHAAQNYGCHITTTTISGRQYDYAAERIKDSGLGDRIRLLAEDYRRLPDTVGGGFDRIVSIEMIEAVGHDNLGEFFSVCSRMLKPEGAMLLQVIVLADQKYESYRRSVDFIQRYVFPGGCAPSLTAMASAMTRASDLRIAHAQDITAHYATTLRRWRESFLARLSEVEALGFPKSFQRMWEFYFCYCEAGFRERTIGDFQLLLTRPRSRVPNLVPQS